MVNAAASWVANPELDERLREDDEALARLGRAETQLRLRIGELLDALFVKDGHHELGFSSIDAYGLERCARNKPWCGESRRVAKRIRERRLNRIRTAMLGGHLRWSMAELLVRHATEENEAELLERAAGKTVRQMRRALRPDAKEEPETEAVPAVRSVGTAEKLFFEATRMGIERVIGQRAGDEATLTALLGEAETPLYALAKAQAPIVVPEISPEHFGLGCPAPPVAVERPQMSEPVALVMEDLPIPASPVAIDRALREAVRKLAARDLEIGRLARRTFSGQGWRRLGYESRERFAVDRVGMSASSLEHRVTLYRRARSSPALREALLSGAIGYEAAMQIGRVDRAGPEDVAAWVRRTVLALRDEVKAVLFLRTIDRSTSKGPPDEAALAKAEELERKVASGEHYRSLFDGKVDPQMSVTLLAGTGDEIRLTVPAELRAHFDRVEAQFRHLAGPKASFVAFMCFCFWQAWMPAFDHVDGGKWSELYHRDRHRCANPVCDRTDVTPHHLQFQAHGGGDELENMATLCSWCHLHGIHEGRLSATPPASNVRWTIGRTPIMEIEGRDVVAR